MIFIKLGSEVITYKYNYIMEKSTFNSRWILTLLSIALLGSTVSSEAAIIVSFEQIDDDTVRGNINGGFNPITVGGIPFGAGIVGVQNTLSINGIDGDALTEEIFLPINGVNDEIGFEFLSDFTINSIGPITGTGTSSGSSFRIELVELLTPGEFNGNLTVSPGAFDEESGLVSFDSVNDFITISGTLSGLGLDSFDNDVIVTTENDGETIDLVVFSTVPEPSSAILIGLGSLTLLIRRRR